MCCERLWTICLDFVFNLLNYHGRSQNNREAYAPAASEGGGVLGLLKCVHEAKPLEAHALYNRKLRFWSFWKCFEQHEIQNILSIFDNTTTN